MSTERAYPVFRPVEPLPLSDASVDELLASLPDLDETAQLAREYAARVYNLGFVLTSMTSHRRPWRDWTNSASY